MIILDLGIREAEVLGQERPYHQIANGSSEEGYVAFVLRGSESNYEKFELIPYDRIQSIASLELEYVEMDTETLLDTLAFSLEHKLENVTLKDVRIQGQMRTALYCPKSLKNYHLEYNLPIGREANFTLDDCNSCVGGFDPVKPNMTGILGRHCLDALILWEHFWKPKPGDDFGTFVRGVSNLSFNVFISLWGLTYLKINGDAKEVVSVLPFSDELCLNLTQNSVNFKTGIERLSLRNVKLDVKTLNLFWGSLVELHLDNVELMGLEDGERLSQRLSNFSQLEQLTLKFGDFVKPPTTLRVPLIKNSVQHVIFVEDLPTTLKNLSLAHVRLDTSRSTPINFHLDALTLYQTDIGQKVFENFGKIFNVRTIAWHVRPPFWSQSTSYTWPHVLGKILEGHIPDWILVDNSFVGRFGQRGYQNSTYFPIPPSSTLFYAKIATINRPRRPPYKMDPQTLDEGKSLWFQRLNMEKFINKNLELSTIW